MVLHSYSVIGFTKATAHLLERPAMSSSTCTYNELRDNMLYHKTCNIMYTALTDMICTLLQCNVCTCEPASVVEQLVKGQRSHPTSADTHVHSAIYCHLQSAWPSPSSCAGSLPQRSHTALALGPWGLCELQAELQCCHPEVRVQNGTSNVFCEVEIRE